MKIEDLQAAYDYATLAAAFGTDPKRLKSHLYGLGSGYKNFQIAKKSGGVRQISAPVRYRKKLQRKLLPVLQEFYRPHRGAHGFISRKGVRTNAEVHVGKKIIINVDLNEFFSSISFKRVRGIFLKSPFSLNWTVANVLAQICCHQSVLPTGGATSPVISNIILSRLDKRLSNMVARLGGDYSRYADDLTFSFNRPLGALSSLVTVDSAGELSVGGTLAELVASEGFSINQEKLRIAQGGSRKVVTGLVINEKVNVSRKWLAEFESKVYAVEKFGWKSVASADYPEEKPPIGIRMLQRRLHGKLSFLYMVRGRGDWVCADLAYRFNKVSFDVQLRVPSVELISHKQRLPRGVLIVVCYTAAKSAYAVTSNQGTAFCIESGLLITAAHVLIDEDTNNQLEYVYVMNERSKEIERCEVLVCDEDRDVAILKVSSGNVGYERHRFALGEEIASGATVSSIGYPNYVLSARASIQEHQVIREFVASAVQKCQITGAVSGGSSGSPVVDVRCRVVGFIHKGTLAVGGIPEIVATSEVRKAAAAAGITIEPN